MYSLLKKMLFINKDNPKLPYLYRFLIFFIRPLIQQTGVTCFVACPNKPWGCNLEAFVCYQVDGPLPVGRSLVRPGFSRTILSLRKGPVEFCFERIYIIP